MDKNTRGRSYFAVQKNKWKCEIHKRTISAKTFANISFISRSLIRTLQVYCRTSPTNDVVNEIIRRELVLLFELSEAIHVFFVTGDRT